MEKKYLTIKETAEKLGIDPATVRRRIKKGEIKAEFLDGSYGKQYMVLAEQFEPKAEVYTDVAAVTRQINVADLAQLIRAQVRDDVREEIAAGTERLIRIIEEQDKCIDALTEELRKSRQQSVWTRIFGEK